MWHQEGNCRDNDRTKEIIGHIGYEDRKSLMYLLAEYYGKKNRFNNYAA